MSGATTRRERFVRCSAAEQGLIELRELVAAVVPPEGVTGEFEGTFKKVKIENGIIIEIELE